MIKVASLRYGVVFKKAFCDPEIFTGFIRDVLGIKIEIDHVETEKTFDPPIGKISSRFDLFAEDVKNRVIVDIQHVKFPDHYHRFLHYHCVALLEQVASSQDYSPQLKVYTIVVLTSGDRHQTDISMIEFDPKDLSGRPLGEIHHKIIYLCPKYTNNKTPEPIRQWLLAIEDSLDNEVDETNYQIAEIQKTFMTIEKDKVSPDEMAKMKDEYSYELIKREEYDKGVQEGIERGIQQGIETGIQQGARQNALETAKKLLSKGLDASLISEITGLRTDEILELEYYCRHSAPPISKKVN
jgi:predicted transposase/invertase (TIGR01784 family)